jgi:hypothetical protein
VYGEVAAAEAERRHDVYNFRRSYLRDGLFTEGEAANFQLPGRYTSRLLTTEEADAFLEGRETGRGTLDRSTMARGKLRRLAGRLARSYNWRERDAAHFVLTGREPVYRPVRVAVGFSGDITSDHVPNSARASSSRPTCGPTRWRWPTLTKLPGGRYWAATGPRAGWMTGALR